MDKIKKMLAVSAAIVTLLAAGCSKNKDSSSQSDDTSVSESSSQTEDSSSAADSSKPVEIVQGDKIKTAAAFFDNENYEYEFRLTGDGTNAKVSIAKNSGNYMKVTEYAAGSMTIICVGDTTYRYDSLTKTYSKKKGGYSSLSEGNMITETVKKKLAPTNTHKNKEDAEKYDHEEYTYTAAAYITVLDFYFDKSTGRLAKYTATYSVEGEDNEVQTREIRKMSPGTAPAIETTEEKVRQSYTDFDNLTEQRREDLCNRMIAEYGITDDELYNFGLTKYDLKTVEYEKFAGMLLANAKTSKDDSSKTDSSKPDSSQTQESSAADSKDSSKENESSAADSSEADSR